MTIARILSLVTTFLADFAIGGTVLYPAPGDLPASDQYEVRVLVDKEWKDSYVYIDHARKDGNGAQDLPGRTFSWTTLETSGPVKIRVTRKEGPFGNVTVRPLRFAIGAVELQRHHPVQLR